MPPEIMPVLLAGGEGKRLRPLTSSARPKPLIKPFSNYSLLQESLMRVKSFAAPVIVCKKQFAAAMQSEAKAVDVKPQAIIAEVVQRGTTAAIACAALYAAEKDALMLVMPSDHYIEDAGRFQDAVNKAQNLAKEDLVFLGAKPLRPSPRYGYIQTDGQGSVTGFIEKPDRVRAKRLLARGNIYWNTGVFLCRSSYFLTLLKQHAPEIDDVVRRAWVGREEQGSFIIPDDVIYKRVSNKAVDYAVMELYGCGRIVPLQTVWFDVGSWPALITHKIDTLIKKTG